MRATIREFRVQRRYNRYKLDTPVRARVFVDEYLANTISGRCWELGRGGMGAHLDQRLQVGETALLELRPSVSAYGTVRYVIGNYHGFEFSLVTDTARTYIDKLCDRAAEAQG